MGRTARLSSRLSAGTHDTTVVDAAGAVVGSCDTIAICAFAGVVEVIMDVFEEEAAIAYG